jgi:hypothetical protein
VVDVYGERDGMKLIEIEERRRAPLQNVAKILKWVSRSHDSSHVTMIHIFFHEFYGKRQHRSEESLAKFVGSLGSQVFKEKFEYIPIHVSMISPDEGKPTRNNIRDIAQRVAETLSLDNPLRHAANSA